MGTDDIAAIDGVTLSVSELDRSIQFYAAVLGLAPLARGDAEAALGVDGRGFLHLIERRFKSRPRPDRPGLFHLAYLLPQRADLASFAAHLVRHRVRLAGASDHGVSEALYLADPDGHGIEVYVDRPRAQWPEVAGEVRFTTSPLDVAALTKGARPWRGAPAGMVIGHAHLRVGDLDEAERFARTRLGLERRHAAAEARFLAWDGYHHHLAVNVWSSADTSSFDADALGLEEIRLRRSLPAGGGAVRDPQGVVWRTTQPDTAG
jgi:catechol 2,3-dioxygenase